MLDSSGKKTVSYYLNFEISREKSILKMVVFHKDFP